MLSNINIIDRLSEIQKIGHLTDREIQWLLTPKNVSYAELRINNERFPAWRVLFNDVLGPGKGGIRFHPEVCEEEVMSLGFWMMIKDSLAELPFGGAKGGVRFNPKNAAPQILEAVSREYINAFYKVLGQDRDIPAPDVYTDFQIMAWMLDEYEKKVGYHEPGMIAGKPLELQGCVLRDNATARGGFITIKEMVQYFKLNKKDLKIAVQGFGNAGSNLAQMLWKDNFKVVAVSDSQGAVFYENGLDVEQIVKTKANSGSVINFPNGDKISNEEMLELPVNVLILAALENQVTETNASNIQATHIVEIANGPTTYQADEILFARNVIVVPDVLANSGGVIASYFEWSQNRTGNILDQKYLEERLRQKIITSWKKVINIRRKHKNKIDLRTAAYLIAIERILAAGKLRGYLK